MKSNLPLPPSPLLSPPPSLSASIALSAGGISSSVTNGATCGLLFSFLQYKRKLLGLLRKGSIGLLLWQEEVTFSACFTHDEAAKTRARRSTQLAWQFPGAQGTRRQDPDVLMLQVPVLLLRLPLSAPKSHRAPELPEQGPGSRMPLPAPCL